MARRIGNIGVTGQLGRVHRGSTCTQDLGYATALLPWESQSPRSAETGLQPYRRDKCQTETAGSTNTRDNQM